MDGNGELTLKVNITDFLVSENSVFTGAIILSLHLDLVSHGRLRILLGVEGTEWNVRALLLLRKPRQMAVQWVEIIIVIDGLAGLLADAFRMEGTLEAATERVL